MIGKLLHWFYCLDLWEAVVVLAVGTVLYCLPASRLAGRRWWNWLAAGLLLALMAVILHTTLGSRNGGADLQHMFVPFHSYREARSNGNTEIYRSNFMNAALFYPAGLLTATLLPKKWPGWIRCTAVLCVLMIASIGIEVSQYLFALGRFEADDVIHNAAGALLGSLVFQMCRNFGRFSKERKPTATGTDT